jgi:hypothetical protein
MTVAQKNHFKKLLFLFLVWPFLSFLTALRTVFNPASQKIILFFSFMYGYTVYLYSGDIINYGESFNIVYGYTWNDYYYLITHLFSVDKFNFYSPNTVNTQPDPFALSLQFFVSRFTDNPRWFWAIVSTFYTYTVLNLANYVYRQNLSLYFKSRYNIFVWASFFLIIPYYVGVTGVRYWPALFLFVYFLLKYANKKSISYVFFLFIPALIHYSFAAPAVFALSINYIPKKKLVYRLSIIAALIIFFGSSLTSIFDFLKNLTSIFDGTQVADRMSSYTDVELLENRQERASGSNWYVSLRGDLLFYFLIIFNLMSSFAILKLKESKFTLKFYHYFVFFMCLALVTYNLGSIGRLKNIFLVLASIRFISLLYINYKNKLFKRYINIFFMIIVFNTIVNFRAGFYFTDPFLLIHNIFTFTLFESSESLSEFIIGH